MAKRKIRVKDLRGFKFVSDPQISPDGDRVAFVLSEIDYDEDKYLRHIWLADVDSGELRQFTHGPGSDTYPRWSPDGEKMLFLSKGRDPEAKTQLFTINLSGGEAQLVAETEEGVSKPAWAPDSRSILFLSKVWTEKKPEDTDVKVIKRIRYKFNAVGFFMGRRTHLFTVRQGKKYRQLTKGEYDVETAAWSPKGDEIAFITNMEPDADTSRVRDIYKVPFLGGDTVKVTESDHSIVEVSYSPDGSAIVFIGNDQPEELAVDHDLYMMPANGGDKICLTRSFDRSLMMGIGSDLRVSTPNPGAVWSKDGDSLYFLTSDTPYCNVYRVGLMTGKVETVIKDKTVDGFSVSDDGKIAFNAMSATAPCELYILDGEEKKLSGFNDKLLNGLDLVEPEHFIFTNRLGRVVDGWIIKPVGWEPDETYPCILEMHGGPRGVYGDGIFQEFHLLSAEGYAVIYTNPRGSAGYEEPYAQAVMRHYGQVDYEDLMDFTLETLSTYQWIDHKRLGLTGGSYGGYTTNWIISQTDRFKAAVTCRSICNWVSKFGVSDIGFMQPESISGEKTYWGPAITEQLKHSPIYYVDNVKTPCLIIHSEKDYRCPMAEAEQWFTALKLNGVPTELIRFPDENHELSRSGKPKHREERLEHILRWFKEYL
ncbi:MAG: S9 family peptidase [Candidatus Bathyarchaeota archaeon]|nr:S9 family peptidase [Candidatus Bathyarchaeota archaeon]